MAPAPPRPLLERWRTLALVLAGLAGLVLVATGAGDGLDQALKNRRADWSERPASGEVHIVEIDARSIAAFKRWPWPRSIHAAAVDRLRESKAALIAFDVDFSSSSEPLQDSALAAALRRAGGSVILPTFRRINGADAAPLPRLADESFLAAANVVTESNGELRSMPFAVEVFGTPRPSLASMVAERPGGAGEFFEIDRSIDPASIPRHSMADLVAGRIPPAALAGKRILIGATAVELGDRYGVPRHGILPGVVAQALAAETLLAGEPPAPVGGGWALLLALGLAGLCLRLRRTAHFAAAFAAIGLALLLLAPPAAAWLGVDAPVAPAMATLAVAAGAGAAGRARARRRETSLADPSTGLPNLAALERDCARRGAATVAVARIDGFTDLLSALGPDGTADLVRAVAERLGFAASTPRVYRIEEAGLAWIEGEQAQLEQRFDSIHAVMRAPFAAGRSVEVRTHFGAARGAGPAARQLCADAGLAALHAAEQGNRWQLFTPSDLEKANWRVSLLAELDSALAGGEVWNAYQPKLELRSGRIHAVEALVRWDHPERGTLAPDSFIPLVEQHGRAADLTLHVMAQALADAAGWSAGGEQLGVAVNISATLLQDHDFLHRLELLLRASGFPADRITLEITESAAMADPEGAAVALEGWRKLGVGVSIDDYGTGQSSLSYLQKMPATELKIDRSFIAAMAAGPRDRILVRSTIAMAHELGLAVVAEGVEDQTCLDLLREMGCDEAQGYGIGRPMAAEAVAAFANAYRAAPPARRKAG
ncbi:MAG TPA: EAL domain-containing protein [Allosphingosinicella sp.]|jgi:EAL domain-containing protein (putative c-di-GMP-specific phosphodiesterase class I)/CHASE2 domain-containing sensor protein|nr:EAL domain-containing protein [Allosphingosinicella sp.]